MKKVTNDDNETLRWSQQRNNLNLDSAICHMKRVGLERFMWEGSNHGEIFMQASKHEFISKRGDNCG